LKLALISNSNLEPLKDVINKNSYFDDIFVSDFNISFMDLLNPDSILHKRRFNYAYINLDGDVLIGGNIKSYNNVEHISALIRSQINNLFQSIDNYKKHNNEIVFIISSIVFDPLSTHTYIDDNSLNSFNDLNNKFNITLKNKCIDREDIIFLDTNRLIQYHGYSNFFDPKYYYLGRIKYSGLGFNILSENIQSIIKAYQGKLKKIIILDLDNTLWNGVIGEEGINKIGLSEDGIDKVFRDFQRSLKELNELGILLAICSKNNFEDAINMINNHPMMVLTEEDFVSIKINWSNKVENIISISEDLNLGLDSFVFLDDSPVERALVKDNIPDVVVPDFPSDKSMIRNWFVNDVVQRYFSKVNLTAEDQKKNKQYKANSDRIKLGKNLDLKSFINTLNIKTSLHIDDKKFYSRIAQLTQKTNQFNLTTNRYNESQIISLSKKNNYQIYCLEYKDKFNHEGIIGAAIVYESENKLFIDTFLLSCRVIGRKVEFTFLDKIIFNLKSKYKSSKILKGIYIPTKKNAVCKDFLKEYGFEIQESSNANLKYEKKIN
tara:strand:+ start:1364 stop:3010 length:1647 start_codon:yes stop_codon:yes gene_type:complete